MTTVIHLPDNAIAHGAPTRALRDGVAVVAIARSALVGGAVAFSQQESIAMSASAAIVTGNESANPDSAAVVAAISAMLAQATPAAQARFALLQAKSADKTATGALWSGLLALAAEGAAPDVIRATGAKLRKDAARVLRVAAGFPADKVKGSKETGAPDYSTASVYAGIVADSLAARRDNPALYDAAIEACAPDAGMLLDDSGIPLSKNDAARVLKDYSARAEAAAAALFPMLADRATESKDAKLARVTVERDALAAEVAALRAQLAAMPQATATESA